MGRLQELTDAYIDAIRAHGPTAIANARADILMEVTTIAQDAQHRAALIRKIEYQLKKEFSKDT